jgi:hypothetical protein
VYVKNGEREPLVGGFVRQVYRGVTPYIVVDVGRMAGWRAVRIVGTMVWLVAVIGGLVVG